jgi:NAD(P)-dependent dehydrogenase (short-subunit alcohol dehydrogenase family)
MTQAARLTSRRVLITGEDTDLAVRLGTVFEQAGAVVRRTENLPPEGSDGTTAADEAVRELGGLDVLVNLGPSAIPGDSDDPDARTQETERALERSMARLVTTTEAVLEAMHAGASIINAAALSVRTLTLAHQALAAAIVDTTEDWATVLIARGIRANVVVGGPILDPSIQAQLDHRSDGHRPDGDTELDAFLYLASENSSHVSGSVISVARASGHGPARQSQEAPGSH